MEYFSLFPSLYEINVRNLHAERCWIWFIRKLNHVYLHMFSYETQDILGILTFQSSAKPGSVGEGTVVLRHPVYWDTYLWAICYPNNSILSTDPSREPVSIHTWHFHQSSAHTPKKKYQLRSSSQIFWGAFWGFRNPWNLVNDKGLAFLFKNYEG